MPVENWIDKVTKLWASISDGGKGSVHAYSAFLKEDWPESINIFPSALSIVENANMEYGVGSPAEDRWIGTTEFHLYPDLGKHRYPGVLKYYNRIKLAAAANIQLSGTVQTFYLRTDDGPSIEGPLSLEYGSENPHWGLIVRWRVFEVTTGTFTVSA